MSTTVVLLLFILCIVACEAVAQACANNLKHTGSIAYLIAGGLFYMLVVYFLSQAHKHAPMGVVNAIWSGLSVIVITLVGYYAFDQKISTSQMAMIGVIGISTAYLSIGIEPSPG